MLLAVLVFVRFISLACKEGGTYQGTTFTKSSPGEEADTVKKTDDNEEERRRQRRWETMRRIHLRTGMGRV